MAISLLLGVLPLPGAVDTPGIGSTPNAAPAPGLPDWYNRVTTAAPGAFLPVRSFDADYHLGWGGLQAAQVHAHCVSTAASHEIRSTFKSTTTGTVRLLYPLDATQTSALDRTTLHPLWLEQTEQSSKKHVTNRVDFTAAGATRRERNLDPDPSEPHPSSKPRQYPLPGLYDMLGVLLYVRSQPLTQGSEVTLPLMTANSPYLATIRVLGRGRIKVRAGEFPAVECSLQLEKIKKDGTLEPRKGFKSAHAWLSDDSNRLLVKAESEVFVGSVSLELDQVAFSDKAER